MNHSPWIAQLKRTRPVAPLEQNLETDVVIVGGGIAGITTAFFLLRETQKRIILLEAHKVAHGATGHNAGQITSYFETPLRELVKTFGFHKAVHAQKVIEEDARMLLEKVQIDAFLQTPHSEFIGYDGLITKEQIIGALEDLALRSQSGVLRIRPLLIDRVWLSENPLPQEYTPLYTAVKSEHILRMLETDNASYKAALPFLSGCMNSALFTEELVGHLLATYKERFLLKEDTPVAKIVLNHDDVLVEAGINTVTAKEVVLCTNGFEFLNIISTQGAVVDTKFHHTVSGIIGYMAGYKEPLEKAPFASIYSKENTSTTEPYYYVTRRAFEDESNATHNLVCIGGPEFFLPDRATYDAKKQYPPEVEDMLGTFTAQTYGTTKPFDYRWHGLMGYTKKGVRLIGREPKQKQLLYNLGCNGVGILTSVYGAYRIAKIINGEIVEPTIFDPE